MTSKVKGVIAGNFDVIHPGYVNMFNEAAKNCDQLYVALHDDPTVERPHKAKPILSVEERKEILLSFSSIYYVVTYNLEKEFVEDALNYYHLSKPNYLG